MLGEIKHLEEQGHIDVYFGDESGFSLNCVIPYCWQFPDEPVTVLPQRGKTINTLGFMRSDGGALQTFAKEGSINAEFVVNAIEVWLATLTKTTVLVLDNAAIHRAKIFQARLDEWESKGLYIFFLPAYSPHLNKIETLWRQCKYRWIKPQDYKDLTTLKTALDAIWSSFGVKYRVNFNQCNSK